MDAKATRFLPPQLPMISSPLPDTDGASEAPDSACASGIHRIVDGGTVAFARHALATDTSMSPMLEQVTLIIYGWKSVEPGTLSWVFPSVGAALAAARAMTNAVKWAIVTGSPLSLDVTTARANGTVIFER